MNWNEVKQNLFVGATWLRGLFMVVYAMLLWITKMVIAAVVVFQFFSVLLTGKLNQHLLALGQSLSMYVYQIYAFLLYNTETMPFPLSPWPKSMEQPSLSVPPSDSPADSTHTTTEV